MTDCAATVAALHKIVSDRDSLNLRQLFAELAKLSLIETEEDEYRIKARRDLGSMENGKELETTIDFTNQIIRDWIQSHEREIENEIEL